MEQLTRGQRMVELLKQDQYAPMSVAEQVTVLYAGTKGYLDDIPADGVRAAETALVRFMHASKQAVLDEIAAKRELSPELEKAVAGAITEFKKNNL